jgi:hypothetical protein
MSGQLLVALCRKHRQIGCRMQCSHFSAAWHAVGNTALLLAGKVQKGRPPKCVHDAKHLLPLENFWNITLTKVKTTWNVGRRCRHPANSDLLRAD